MLLACRTDSNTSFGGADRAETENRLEETQKEAKQIRALSTVEMAEKEESAKKMSEVEKEREALKAKLAAIQEKRESVQARLKDTEEDARQLREEKRHMTKQIASMKASNNLEGIEEVELEKRNILSNMKKLASEKEEMRAVLARLDSTGHNVQSQMKAMGNDYDDESIEVISEEPARFLTMDRRRVPSKSKRGGCYDKQEKLSRSDHGLDFACPQSARPPKAEKQRMTRRSSMGDLATNPAFPGPPLDVPKTPGRHVPKDTPSDWLAKEIKRTSNHGGGSFAAHANIQYSNHGNDGFTEPKGDVGHHSFHGLSPGTHVGRTYGNRFTDFGHSSLQGLSPEAQGRPAGWLGEQISHQSFSDFSSFDRSDPAGKTRGRKIRKDPSIYSKSDDSTQLQPQSQTLAAKREKLRNSERKLRKEMSKSKLNSSNRALVDDGSVGIQR